MNLEMKQAYSEIATIITCHNPSPFIYTLYISSLALVN
jgi:hypothetical protein